MNIRKTIGAVVLSLSMLPLVAVAQQTAPSPGSVSPQTEDRITREVRHEILMLPWYGVFDVIGFRVNGTDVTLTGAVVRPSTKSDAEGAVKHIEGVTNVSNQIDVLPPSSQDDALRLRLFNAIYGYPSLQKYDLGTIKPIRIIVKSGHVSLEGVVDNEADKNTAGIRANSVPGIFEVKYNLQVTGGDSKNK